MTEFIKFLRAFRRAYKWHGRRWDCFSRETKRELIRYWY